MKFYPAVQPRAQLVFYGEPSASLSLYLDGLPPELAAHIAVLPPRRMAADFVQLAGAGLVIFVRGFEDVWRSGMLATLIKIGVKCAWFTDDDLTALHGEQPGFGFYSPEHMRHFAQSMVALIGTTPALCRRLAAFHDHILHWPCVLNEALLHPHLVRAAPQDMTRIAFAGGAFRYDGLKRFVVPLLAGMPGAQLLVAAGPAAAIPGVLMLPFEEDFNRFVALWRAAGPEILVHPPGQTRNTGNKGPGILLAALYLGAAPVVADEPAFAGLGPAQGVLVAGDEDAWRAAIATLGTPAARAAHLAALLAYARTAWAPRHAAAAVSALLSLAAPAEGSESRRRQAAAIQWRPASTFIWRRRLRRLVSRLASRSR